MANHRKVNNYIVDEETQTARLELNRRDGNNFWVTIDLEDLERVLNFPYYNVAEIRFSSATHVLLFN